MGGDLIDLRFLPYLVFYGVAGALLFVVGALVFHVFASQVQLAPYNEPAGARIGFLEPVLAVVILFALAFTWLRYGNLQNVIGDETVRLTLLGRSALTFPEPERSNLVNAAADYATAIAQSEWLTMSRYGDRSYSASDALQRLTTKYAAAQTHSLRERLLLNYSNRLVRELAEQREARLAAARYLLGGTLQVVIVYTLGATLILNWFFGLPSLTTKLVLGSLFAVSVATVLMFNDVLAHAFDGPAVLDNSAYLELAESLRSALLPPDMP